MKLAGLRIQGYRCLADVALPVRSPMILIGPNGSGKTSPLEVLTLLRDAAQERLNDALAERGGISDILFAGGADSLTIRVTALESDQPEIEYMLELAERSVGYVIRREHLTQHRDPAMPQPHFYIQNAPGRYRYFDPNTRKLAGCGKTA